MNARTIGLLLGSMCLSSMLSALAWGQAGLTPPLAGVEAKPIGKVMEALGSVTIEHMSAVLLQANLAAGSSTQVGDPVYQGDVVSTGADGKLSLTFSDGTSFKISNNARMELNEYIYDPKGNSNSTAFNLAKGSFTFLAGAVAKTGNMKIDTPVATMGIRGTAPHVEIAEDGTVKFSTLIEENKSAKDATAKQPPSRVAPLQRRAQAPSAIPDVPPSKTDEKKLKICIGC
jgi:hypothetical protein